MKQYSFRRHKCARTTQGAKGLVGLNKTRVNSTLLQDKVADRAANNITESQYSTVSGKIQLGSAKYYAQNALNIGM